MISMPKKWLFVLNKFNRALVPRKCVFFSFMFVMKFADHCFSAYLSALAYSEIPQWRAVLMSSYPGPRSLRVRSQLDLVQLHVSILELAAVQTINVRVCFASLLTLCSSTLSITTWSRPALFIARRTATNSTGLCHCQRPGGHKPSLVDSLGGWLLIALGAKPKPHPVMTEALP